MSSLSFEPDSWQRAGEEYASVSADFATATQSVLLETTESVGAGGGHPVDAAVGAVLGDVSTAGQEVVARLEESLRGHSQRLRETAEAYREVEDENHRLATELTTGVL